MAVKYGFYSSKSGDRTYSASDLNSFLEGLVSYGIFKNVGNGMRVSIVNNNTIKVNDGKCWFKETFTRVVDEEVFTEKDFPPNSVGNFYIAVEAKTGLKDRINRIRTTVSITSDMMPLAEIKRDGTGNITGVTDLRGTSQCPWITSILGSFTGNDIINSIKNPSFWDFVKDETKKDVDIAIADETERFNTLYNANDSRFNTLYNANDSRFNTLYNTNNSRFNNLYDSNQTRFNEAYEGIDDQVLAEVSKVFKSLPGVMVDILIRDSEEEYILDSNGEQIEASVELLMKWW